MYEEESDKLYMYYRKYKTDQELVIGQESIWEILLVKRYCSFEAKFLKVA